MGVELVRRRAERDTLGVALAVGEPVHDDHQQLVAGLRHQLARRDHQAALAHVVALDQRDLADAFAIKIEADFLGEQRQRRRPDVDASRKFQIRDRAERNCRAEYRLLALGAELDDRPAHDLLDLEIVLAERQMPRVLLDGSDRDQRDIGFLELRGQLVRRHRHPGFWASHGVQNLIVGHASRS